jgi:multidrug resistance efflux pump
MTDAATAASPAAAGPPVATEIDVGTGTPPPNPMRKVILIALGLLLVLFIYHVLSDRYTPYSSQARVEAFLTQVAPEVAGDVLEVGVKDNGAVRKGQLLFRIDPSPTPSQSARPRPMFLSRCRVPMSRWRTSPRPGRKSPSNAPTCPPAANSGGIVSDLVGKRALAETQGIRARADTAKSSADLSAPQADLRKAEANLGAPGLNNPKVRQALAALDQARLDLRNTEIRAPADGTVTNLRLAVGQYVGPGQPLLSFLERGPRWISADMRENQLGNVAPGQDVTMALDIKPGKLFHGRVHSIGRCSGGRADGTIYRRCPKIRMAARSPTLPNAHHSLAGYRRKKPESTSTQWRAANVIIFTKDNSLMNPIPVCGSR